MIVKTINELELENPDVARSVREARQAQLKGYTFYDYVLTELALKNEKLKATLAAVIDEDPELVFGCTCTTTQKCAHCQLRDLK